MPEFESPPFDDSFAVLENPIEAKRRKFDLPKLIAGFEWKRWFGGLIARVNEAPRRAGSVVSLTNQDASIGVTSLPIGSVEAGLYRVSYYFRITQAATTSSSLQFTLGWTESALALTKSPAAETGNTTGSTQSDSFLIRVDGDSVTSYSTTYASVGATPMKYRLDIVVEQVKGDVAA